MLRTRIDCHYKCYLKAKFNNFRPNIINVTHNFLVHDSAKQYSFFLSGSQQQHECEKRNTLESRSSLTCKHILVVELAKSVFRSAQKQGLLRQTEQH